jgi:hypothetical protein
MKKYFLGIIAVLLAVGFSAFTNIREKPESTDLYWFQISNKYTSTQPVGQADAAFIQQSATPPLGANCSSGMYDCVAGFTATQVNSSNQLNDNSQVPASVPRTKSN